MIPASARDSYGSGPGSGAGTPAAGSPRCPPADTPGWPLNRRGIAQQPASAGSAGCGGVLGVVEPAGAQREAAAADAAVQRGAQLLKFGDPLVDVADPGGRHLVPVGLVRGSLIRQLGQRRAHVG